MTGQDRTVPPFPLSDEPVHFVACGQQFAEQWLAHSHMEGCDDCRRVCDSIDQSLRWLASLGSAGVPVNSSDEAAAPDDELEAVAQAAFGAARAGGGVSEITEAMLPELRLLVARVHAEGVAERDKLERQLAAAQREARDVFAELRVITAERDAALALTASRIAEAVVQERQRLHDELGQLALPMTFTIASDHQVRAVSWSHVLSVLAPTEPVKCWCNGNLRAHYIPTDSVSAAGSVPVATPTSGRERAGGDGLRSVSRTGQLPGRLPVETGQTSDTELLRDALRGWIDQRSSAFSAEDFDAAGSLLRRVDAVLAVPVATPGEPVKCWCLGNPTVSHQRGIDGCRYAAGGDFAGSTATEPSVGTGTTEDVESAPISPEFRQRLIAAANRSLRVRRAVLLLAGHAAGHLPGAEHACRTCHTHWPCEATHRAARPALEAFAECDASLAASVVARLRTERDQLTAEVASTRVEVGRMGDLYASACEYGNEACRGRDDLTAEVARYRAATEQLKLIALRFGREYHADDPGAMAQDTCDHFAAALRDGEAMKCEHGLTYPHLHNAPRPGGFDTEQCPGPTFGDGE